MPDRRIARSIVFVSIRSVRREIKVILPSFPSWFRQKEGRRLASCHTLTGRARRPRSQGTLHPVSSFLYPLAAMPIIALICYNLLLLLLSPLLVVYMLWRLLIAGKSRRGLAERLGFLPAHKLAGEGPCIWLHAVSVGETLAAKPVWEALLAALPGWRLLHSTTTDTGQAQAEKHAGEHGQIIYLPFDFLPCVWLALARARPRLVVLMETELWPNFLAVAHLLGCKVVLANGIVSDRSLRGAARMAPVYRWMLGNIDRFCMQSAQDAERIIRLGADPARVCVVGNSKFDQVVRQVPLGEQMMLRHALGLNRDEPLLLAGSTHPGEEEIVLRAFRLLTTLHPRARLLIAPRHIQRAQAIAELAVAHGFTVACRTKVEQQPSAPDAVLILDTIGELARAYALCTAAFVGGSLAPIGGHNVLEPLGLGKPAIFGPHMEKNRDIAAAVLEAGVGFQITDAESLAACWQRFLDTPELGKEIIDKAANIFHQHQGAAKRGVEEIVKVLDMAADAPRIVR